MSIIQTLFPRKFTVKELRRKVGELQNSVNILLGEVTRTSSYAGNSYQDYRSAIQELARKYEGTADWGVLQVGNIIDLRSAFTIGQGIKIVEEKKGKKTPNQTSREFEFISEFIRHNNLDEEMPQELAKEAEIEGRCLVKLIPNIDKKQIDIRFISYSSKGYKVVNEKGDYQHYVRVTYGPSSQTNGEAVKYEDMDNEATTLEEGEFVYKKFSGRLSKVNELMPKTAKVLTQCENLDKALWDWRRINNLFSKPTPVIECENSGDVATIKDYIENTKWNIGRLLVLSKAKYTLVGADTAGIDALEKEIIANAKIISGATGVPVNFLGYTDLISNKSLSTDLFELINASTNKERHIWEGFYEELFNKALMMANENFQTGYKENLIKAQILQITEAKLKELVEVWMPLYNSGVVDLDYMLSKIPDADPERIKKSQEESAIKTLKSIQDAERQRQEEEEHSG